MGKKSKKEGKTKKEAVKSRDMSEIHGLLLIAFSVITVISLLSFNLHRLHSHHWLGLVGYIIGWTFNALFGLSSYLISFYIAWIGWRLFFRKALNHMVLKSLYVALMVVSTSMLLTLLEDVSPSIANRISSLFYGSNMGIYYHLGGAPFYFFYQDLPLFNFSYIFNTLGVGIIFLSTWIASVIFLAKISPLAWVQKGITLFQKIKAKAATERSDLLLAPSSEKLGVSEKIEKSVTPKNSDSDFLRYVKLRIPQGNSQSGEPYQQDISPINQNELLAIHPEINLKTRPSLSRKALIEKPGNIPAIDEPSKPKKNEYLELPSPSKPSQPSKEKLTKRESALEAQQIYNGDFTSYQLPPSNSLTNAKKIDSSLLKKDLKRKAEVLEETLQSFGIEAKVGQINCGPTITSFEVHPAIGVKVQKIKTLENDIALNMEAKSIRIIAPIPGKAAVGIEVPNAQPEEVGFKDMLMAYQQGGKKFNIPILLGKAVNGDYVMSDLSKMPHCIIAGATGSGKSVCINTIVMSIVMNAKPDEIKLIMVDPKKVELTPYTRLPHMLAPVITEPNGACSAMNWLVKEMEKRYDLLKQIGVRNIDGFNSRKIDKEFEAALELDIPEKLPFIVGIVDELADLMMVSSSDIETPIARIAQMARAVGIHLILATQRPSREVITGLIKANFPTRISFKVSSRVNSQIVLDDVGAESLLGNGDMLFLPPGASHLVRAQGAFIRDEDINTIVKHLCDQAPPNYVIESFDTFGQIDLSAADAEDSPSDSLYAQAKEVVIGTGNASTTFLQRKLKIGYARAASLIDMLEQKGIVGPAEGSKPRKILVLRQDRGEILDDEEE